MPAKVEKLDSLERKLGKATAEMYRQAAQELTGLPQWRWYEDRMVEFEQAALKSLVQVGSDQHDYWKGRIEGLREAFYYPHKVLQSKTD